MALEFVILISLIIANGLFALAEIAIVSARKARLQQRANEGDTRARAALKLANDPGDFLSTVQVGITLVGVAAGAFGGATFARVISDWLRGFPALAPYSGAIGITVVILAITYFSLIFGELVPKRLALHDPERVAASVSGPMLLLSRLVHPVVRFLSISTNLVLRLIGARPTSGPPVTEEEIKVMIEQGTAAGVFEEAEQDMVSAIFRLSDRRVGTLMTPRTEIVWLDLDDPAHVTQRKITESVHSRFPVAQGSLDNVQGVVQAKQLLADILAGLPLDLFASLTEAPFVPESMAALNVLEIFKESRMQIALVLDEFGGLQGLVTLDDILEAIVGEIPMLGQEFEPEVVQREDGSWLVDGMLPVDEFKEIFDITTLPDENRGYYQTVGGLMMTGLGRIPEVGDHFELTGHRLEVMDMDGNRVDKVLVVPPKAGE